MRLPWRLEFGVTEIELRAHRNVLGIDYLDDHFAVCPVQSRDGVLALYVTVVVGQVFSAVDPAPQDILVLDDEFHMVGAARFDACRRTVGVQHEGVVVGDALEDSPCIAEAAQRQLVAVRRIFGAELEDEPLFAAQLSGVEFHGYDLRLDGVEPLVAEHDRAGAVLVGLDQLAAFDFPVARSGNPFAGIILRIRCVNLFTVYRNADIGVLRRRLVGSQTDAADRSGLVGKHTQLRVGGQIHVRTVVGEHALDPVGTPADDVVVPYQNQVDAHAAFGILHQRGVGGHRHQIRIAFHAHHERSFAQCAFHVARTDAHVAGVFADIGFVALFARELVEVVGVGVEPAGEVVEMGIVHVVTVDPRELVAHRQAGNDRNVGIRFADTFVEAVVIFGVHALWFSLPTSI